MNTLLIETNQICDFNCEYCFYNDYGRLTNILTPQQFNVIILKEMPQTIYLTGGEPTSSPYFIDYVNSCFDKNIKCHIFTNGWRLLNDQDILNSIIKHVETIIISLDCDYNYNPRPYQKDIFQKLKALSPNIKSKIKVKISLNSFNINGFENTIKNLLDIGITQLSINIVHNITSSHHNFELSNTDITKIFEVIEKYIECFDKNYIKHLKDFYIDKKNNIKCQANSSFAFYNCKGIRFPCPSNYENNFDCVTKECICLWEMYNET